MLVYRAAPLHWQGWLTLAVVLLTLYAMVKELAGPDLILMAGLFTLAAFGVLTPRETFEGFANPALAAVGALFIVSAALRETGALEATVGRLIDRIDLRLYSGVVGVGLVGGCLMMSQVSSVIMLGLAIFTMRLFGQGLIIHTSFTIISLYFIS